MAEEGLLAREVSKWLLLALMATAFFMVVLDVSVVNVALPSLAKDLNFAPNNLQWVITAYSITFGGFLLLGGRTADVFGRRRLFIVAVSLFSLASLACGLSQSSTMLIVARGVQGLMAAFMTPTALSIVLTQFEEGRERNLALGIWAAVASSGAAVGVVLGGVLTEYLDWRWNFFINVPVGFTVVALSALLLPRSDGDEKAGSRFRDLDHVGSVMATLGLVALVFGLSRAPIDGWGSVTVLTSLVLSAVALCAFVINEARSRDPLLPLGLFKVKNVAGGNLAALIIAASLFSLFYFLTLYVQTVLGYSPIRSGVGFLVTPFVIAVFSGITSQLVGRIGYKPTMVIGPLILAVGLFLLSGIRVHGNYWHDVLPGLAIAGTGLGMTFVSLTLAATSGAPVRLSGLVSGMLNTSQQVGGAIGLAVLSVFANSATNSALAVGDNNLQAKVAGYHYAFHASVGFAVAAFVAVMLLIRNRPGEVGEESQDEVGGQRHDRISGEVETVTS
jgi:drug resistance transporter, EmrB/QacA subfamily